MCECGCNELSINKAVKVGENVLIVEIYPGCRDCEAGVVLSLYLFPPDEAENFGVDLEDIDEFVPDRFGFSQLDFPLIGQEDMVEASKILEDGDPIEYGDCVTLAECLSQVGLELLQKGMDIRKRKLEDVHE